jgi:hypothetical protein
VPHIKLEHPIIKFHGVKAQCQAMPMWFHCKVNQMLVKAFVKEKKKTIDAKWCLEIG